MDHTDNQLRACVKALNEVIAPALAADDAPAAEQAFLVTDYLGYLRTRLDFLHDRHRFEARVHLEMAEAVRDDAVALDARLGPALDEAIATSRAALADPATRDPDLRACAAQATAAVTAAVRGLADRDDPRRVAVERRVVELSGEKIAVDRAWHLPQGLDGDPSSVLSLPEALGIVAPTAATTGQG